MVNEEETEFITHKLINSSHGITLDGLNLFFKVNDHLHLGVMAQISLSTCIYKLSFIYIKELWIKNHFHLLIVAQISLTHVNK